MTINLLISRITIYLLKAIYYSPLKLIPKLDKIFHYIYNFFLLKPRQSLFINTIILKTYFTLTYSTINNILALILFTKKKSLFLNIILKALFRISRSLLPTNIY